MKKHLCLLAALTLALTTVSCDKVQARMHIKDANEYYTQEKYDLAIREYEAARSIDSSFADLDRMIGYSALGLYKPGDASADNLRHADRAIKELRTYLKKRPDDETAQEALINLYLNAEMIDQAIGYFKDHLRQKPADLDAVKSIATLYAKQGDFEESLNWYEKITLLDSKNPEAFYVFGVVLYEKVSKDPPADRTRKLELIEKGKAALQRATELRENYFEALVYLNLLYRQQAVTEEDPAVQQQLLAKADEVRGQAMRIAKERKEAAEAQSAKEVAAQSTGEVK